jgi:hypothetical protein
MITRLMRLSVLRGTALEERYADQADASIREFERLCRELPELVRELGGSVELADAVHARLASSEFPFRRERALPRITVNADVGGVGLEARIRRGAEWTLETKRALIERGYRLTDEQLRAAAIGSAAPAAR